jgi:hypothetical protein
MMHVVSEFIVRELRLRRISAAGTVPRTDLPTSDRSAIDDLTTPDDERPPLTHLGTRTRHGRVVTKPGAMTVRGLSR